MAGIVTGRNSRRYAGLHQCLVFWIGYAKPGATGLNHRTFGLSGPDQVVNHAGNVAFRVHFLAVLVEKFDKNGFKLGQQCWGKAPEIHRDYGIGCDLDRLTDESVAADSTIGLAREGTVLFYAVQGSMLYLTDAAVHAAM